MAYLNREALLLVSHACNDHAVVCSRIAEDETLPPRLRAEFAARRRMAMTLMDLFSRHPAFDAESVDLNDYKAPIWEDVK